MLRWYVVETNTTMGNGRQEDTSISIVQQQKRWNSTVLQRISKKRLAAYSKSGFTGGSTMAYLAERYT